MFPATCGPKTDLLSPRGDLLPVALLERCGHEGHGRIHVAIGGEPLIERAGQEGIEPLLPEQRCQRLDSLQRSQLASGEAGHGLRAEREHHLGNIAMAMSREGLVTPPTGQHDVDLVPRRELEHGDLVGQVRNAFQFHRALDEGHEIVLVGRSETDRHVAGRGSHALALVMMPERRVKLGDVGRPSVGALERPAAQHELAGGDNADPGRVEAAADMGTHASCPRDPILHGPVDQATHRIGIVCGARQAYRNPGLGIPPAARPRSPGIKRDDAAGRHRLDAAEERARYGRDARIGEELGDATLADRRVLAARRDNIREAASETNLSPAPGPVKASGADMIAQEEELSRTSVENGKDEIADQHIRRLGPVPGPKARHQRGFVFAVDVVRRQSAVAGQFPAIVDDRIGQDCELTLLPHRSTSAARQFNHVASRQNRAEAHGNGRIQANLGG